MWVFKLQLHKAGLSLWHALVWDPVYSLRLCMPLRRGGEECSLSNSSSSLWFFFQISWRLILIVSTHFKTVKEAKTCLCGLSAFPFSGNKCCYVYLQIRSQPGQPHCPRSLKNLSIFEKHSFHLFFSPGWVFFFCKVRKDKAEKSLWYSSWKKGWEIDPRVFAGLLSTRPHLLPTAWVPVKQWSGPCWTRSLCEFSST